MIVLYANLEDMIAENDRRYEPLVSGVYFEK
jgi:hypothetical protein